MDNSQKAKYLEFVVEFLFPFKLGKSILAAWHPSLRVTRLTASWTLQNKTESLRNYYSKILLA